MGRDGGGSKTQVRERAPRGSSKIEHKLGKILNVSLTSVDRCCQSFLMTIPVRFMGGLMRSQLDSMPDAPELPAAEDLRAAIGAWLAHMAHELGRADNTLVAYERDVRQLLAWMKRDLGRAPELA